METTRYILKKSVVCSLHFAPGRGSSKPDYKANPGLARIFISVVVTFLVGFSVYTVCTSVLSLAKLKLYKM